MREFITNNQALKQEAFITESVLKVLDMKDSRVSSLKTKHALGDRTFNLLTASQVLKRPMNSGETRSDLCSKCVSSIEDNADECVIKLLKSKITA